jgi:PAS domain S-box-containing protein
MRAMSKLMQKIFPDTLGFRLPLMVSLVLASLIAIYGYHGTYEETDRALTRVKSQAQTLADNIATASQLLMVSDIGKLKKFIASNTAHPDIAEIQVYNVKGKLLVNSPETAIKQDITGKSRSITVNERNNIVIWEPVKRKGLIGWIKLDYNIGELQGVNDTFWRLDVFDSSVIIFVVALACMVALRKPLNAIQTITEFISGMDKHKGMKVSLDFKYAELRELSNALKQMSERLSTQDKTIKSAMFELEMQKYALDQHCIVTISNVDGKIVYSNYKFCDISGYSQEELMNNDHKLVNSGYHSEEFFKDMWETIKKGHVWRGEIRNRRKNGAFYWVDTTIVPVVNNAGKILRYVSIRTDISNRKAYEEQLSRLAEFPEKSPNLIISADIERGLIYTNPAMKRYMEELNNMGEFPDKLLPDNFMQIVANCIQDKKVRSNYEVTIAGHSWSWSFSPLAEQNIVHGFGSDITDRQKFELELQKKNDDLEVLSDNLEVKVKERTFELEKVNNDLIRADRVKNEFLATVSHELRTPLTSIKSFSEILKDDLETIELQTQRKYLSIIDKESDRLERLISNILDLQKMDESEAIWRDMDINVIEEVQSAVESFYGAYKDKGVGLRTQWNVSEAIISIDPDKFKQVIINLLSNALKFTNEGEVVVGVEVENVVGIVERGHGSNIQVWVKDTGIGIQQDSTNKIFERFIQLDSTSTRKYGGTGLGLSISKDIIEHYNGNIIVKSEPGSGTTFFINLPQRNNYEVDSRREAG